MSQAQTLQVRKTEDLITPLISALFIVMFLFFCLLYTSDAADERSSVDLGGRRLIKKKN